jgi:hypothetical protein
MKPTKHCKSGEEGESSGNIMEGGACLRHTVHMYGIITFSSVYGIYTGSFLMRFPCVDVLYFKLIHPLHFSSFYLSPLLMVILTGLNIMYSYLCRKYINHIHLLYFFLSPSPLHKCPSLSMTCFSFLSSII